MIALILAAWLYIATHAGLGSALADPVAPPTASCTTDTECGCTDDCLD